MKLAREVIKSPFLRTKGADEEAPLHIFVSHALSDLNQYPRAPVSLIKCSRASVSLTKTVKTAQID